MAGQDKRTLMSVGDGKRNAKKGRTQALVPVMKPNIQQQVTEDIENGELAHGRNMQALVPLVKDMPSQIDVRIDVTLLHCQACRRPLKPPVFMCASGHAVCCHCRKSHDEMCGVASIHCGGLGAFICASKVACSYKDFGCDSYVVYHQADAHMRACHFAPCKCPDSGCGFVGAPAGLIEHFATIHSRPITYVRYGRSWNLSLPLSKSWHVIVGQEDQNVFLVTLGELGAAATLVSLVCVRANNTASTATRFWCKLSVVYPGGDKDKVVLMSSTVSNNAMFDGTPRPGEGMFLTVPRELISGELLAINVRIDPFSH
ncbi:hypothetical protein QYE76_047228 [Lolium multiflorum]|uniref:SIAH-type domain-containing protein n=1 Tax=Lolium multiflorum TaxID=4521 RepID=A0AAD8TPF1_LOLMU|nr:hypothetical protein QYE76_047228 [Lolium multiflorum]